MRETLAGALAAAMIVGSIACTPAAASPPPAVAGPDVPAREWFSQTGCTACHPVLAYGIWHPGVTAPDLSLAVEDVPRRFDRTLEEFLAAPTGTMAMVLSSRIPLTDVQRQVAIAKLHEAYMTAVMLRRQEDR